MLVTKEQDTTWKPGEEAPSTVEQGASRVEISVMAGWKKWISGSLDSVLLGSWMLWEEDFGRRHWRMNSTLAQS